MKSGSSAARSLESTRFELWSATDAKAVQLLAATGQFAHIDERLLRADAFFAPQPFIKPPPFEEACSLRRSVRLVTEDMSVFRFRDLSAQRILERYASEKRPATLADIALAGPKELERLLESAVGRRLFFAGTGYAADVRPGAPAQYIGIDRDYTGGGHEDDEEDVPRPILRVFPDSLDTLRARRALPVFVRSV